MGFHNFQLLLIVHSFIAHRTVIVMDVTIALYIVITDVQGDSDNSSLETVQKRKMTGN
jgi:hypothetical protein